MPFALPSDCADELTFLTYHEMIYDLFYLTVAEVRMRLKKYYQRVDKHLNLKIALS